MNSQLPIAQSPIAELPIDLPVDFDLTLILQPLLGEDGCGVDMQYHKEYDFIRRTRQVGQDALPAGVWERETKKTDWPDIGKKCFDLLTNRSKDLQVAAWLVESLVHQYQLPGYAQGVSLLARLTTQFWDGAYPLLEDGDSQTRLRPIDWLLQNSLKWLDADLLASDLPGQALLWAKIEQDLTQLDAFLEEKIPGQAPSFQLLRTQIRVKRASAAPSVQASSAGTARPTNVSEQFSAVPDAMITVPALGQAIASRDMAYDKLGEIAAFLARVEPHSPVPMVLQTLVSWRHASFDDLLRRLPQDGGGVYELLRLFGTPDQSS